MEKQSFVVRISGNCSAKATHAVHDMFGKVYVSTASDAMFESVHMPSLTTIEPMPPAVRRLPFFVPCNPSEVNVSPFVSGYDWCLKNWGSCSDIDPWTVQFLSSGLDESYLPASEYVEYMRVCRENLMLSRYAGVKGERFGSSFFGYTEYDECYYQGTFYGETVNFIPYIAFLKLSEKHSVTIDVKFAYTVGDIHYVCFLRIIEGRPTALVIKLKEPMQAFDKSGFFRKGKKLAYCFSEYIKSTVPARNMTYDILEPTRKGWDDDLLKIRGEIADAAKRRFVSAFCNNVFDVYDFSSGNVSRINYTVQDVIYRTSAI